MLRDERAYLNDIVEACAAIGDAVVGLDLDGYRRNRLVRSSVEREFITIGEAIAVLSRVAPTVCSRITQARRIVDFRNQLTHEYPSVDDAVVWLIAAHDAPILRRECLGLLEEIGHEDP